MLRVPGLDEFLLEIEGGGVVDASEMDDVEDHCRLRLSSMILAPETAVGAATRR